MLDITEEPIEVAPTAHYSMGGVRVRPEDHGTGVAGLYAIGEASSGLHGLAHAFDLQGSLLAARATLECALERRETRGCHNRSDFPEQDPQLRGNFVWSLDGGVGFEPLAEVPEPLQDLDAAPLDDSPRGKLVE